MTWQELHELDQQITLYLNSLHSGVTDPIMIFFSNIPVWIPMYILVAVFLFIRLGWKKALIAVISITLTFVFCDQLANLFKNGIGRLRPCHDEFMVGEGLRILEGKGGMFGFFSGHASNAFGFATSSSMAFRIGASMPNSWNVFIIYVKFAAVSHAGAAIYVSFAERLWL